jgi:hypothetical protein
VDLNFVLFFYDCDDTSEYDAFALYAMGTLLMYSMREDIIRLAQFAPSSLHFPARPEVGIGLRGRTSLTSSFFRRGARHVMSTSAQIFYCYHVTYTLLSSTSKKKKEKANKAACWQTAN